MPARYLVYQVFVTAAIAWFLAAVHLRRKDPAPAYAQHGCVPVVVRARGRRCLVARACLVVVLHSCLYTLTRSPRWAGRYYTMVAIVVWGVACWLSMVLMVWSPQFARHLRFVLCCVSVFCSPVAVGDCMHSRQHGGKRHSS